MKQIIASYSKIRSKQATTLGIFSAAYVVLMLAAQLFKFDELPGILRYFWNTSNEESMLILAAVLVILELLALPALLGMMLSSLMRLCSMVAGGLVATYWLAAGVYVVSNGLVRDGGILGGIAAELTSVILPVMSVLLASLIVSYWASVYGFASSSPSKKSKSTS